MSPGCWSYFSLHQSLSVMNMESKCVNVAGAVVFGVGCVLRGGVRGRGRTCTVGSSSSHSSPSSCQSNLGEGVMHFSRTFDVLSLAEVRETGVVEGKVRACVLKGNGQSVTIVIIARALTG